MLQILEGNAASPKHRAFTDCHARPDDRTRRHPGARPDMNGFGFELEIWIVDVMCSSKQKNEH